MMRSAADCGRIRTKPESIRKKKKKEEEARKNQANNANEIQIYKNEMEYKHTFDKISYAYQVSQRIYT